MENVTNYPDAPIDPLVTHSERGDTDVLQCFPDEIDKCQSEPPEVTIQILNISLETRRNFIVANFYGIAKKAIRVERLSH